MVLEILKELDQTFADRFPKRLKKSEKEAFLHHVAEQLSEWGYLTEQHTLSKFPQNRLLLTRSDAPQVIFSAHYDTPTMMPIFFQWLFTWISAGQPGTVGTALGKALGALT